MTTELTTTHQQQEDQERCRHMDEAIPSGACDICCPAMFAPRAEVQRQIRALEMRRDLFIPIEAAPKPTVPREMRVKPLKFLPPPDPAPWQELTPSELAVLDTLVDLAREPEFDGITFDQLCAMFIDAAHELGLRSWTAEELSGALEGLQQRAYAGPYDTGEWAPAGKGIAVIDDYKRRTGRAR